MAREAPAVCNILMHALQMLKSTTQLFPAQLLYLHLRLTTGQRLRTPRTSSQDIQLQELTSAHLQDPGKKSIYWQRGKGTRAKTCATVGQQLSVVRSIRHSCFGGAKTKRVIIIALTIGKLQVCKALLHCETLLLVVVSGIRFGALIDRHRGLGLISG